MSSKTRQAKPVDTGAALQAPQRLTEQLSSSWTFVALFQSYNTPAAECYVGSFLTLLAQIFFFFFLFCGNEHKQEVKPDREYSLTAGWTLTAPVNYKCIKDVFVKLIAYIAHKGMMQTSEIVEQEEVAVTHNQWRKEPQG